MPKQKTQNPKEKKISIEAQLPVPLGELATYALPKKANEEEIVPLLDAKPHVANYVMGKIARSILRKKKAKVKLLNLEHAYNDSQKLIHGVAYFKVTLEGTEKALRRVAGEDKLFEFDWQQPHAD